MGLGTREDQSHGYTMNHGSFETPAATAGPPVISRNPRSGRCGHLQGRTLISRTSRTAGTGRRSPEGTLQGTMPALRTRNPRVSQSTLWSLQVTSKPAAPAGRPKAAVAPPGPVGIIWSREGGVCRTPELAVPLTLKAAQQTSLPRLRGHSIEVALPPRLICGGGRGTQCRQKSRHRNIPRPSARDPRPPACRDPTRETTAPGAVNFPWQVPAASHQLPKEPLRTRGLPRRGGEGGTAAPRCGAPTKVKIGLPDGVTSKARTSKPTSALPTASGVPGSGVLRVPIWGTLTLSWMLKRKVIP